jgi:hypothetical protein
LLSLPTSTPLPEIEPPPDLVANKRARVTLDLMMQRNPQFRAEIYERCKNDFVFWAEHFCWSYDAFKPVALRQQPLVLFQFQKEMCLVIVENIWKALHEDHYRWNGGSDKARRMTATYSSLLVLQWFAQFHGVSSIVTSKTEEDVDKIDDMNTPFERLRWQISLQPDFLLPPTYSRTNKQQNKRKLLNFGNGGQIAGSAPTGAALRQARAPIWLADEFAFVDNDNSVWEASSGTVKVRLVMSTPNGPHCKFYRLIYKKDKTVAGNAEQFHLFELDWWKHPQNAVGLYRKSDGTLSSPFMDNVISTSSRQVVAREWMRNHSESVGGLIYFMFRSDSQREELQPDPATKMIYCSWDPGISFSVTIGQRDRYSRLLLLREIVMTNEDVDRGSTLLRAVATRVISVLESDFENFEIKHIGDPYASRMQIASQEKTEYDMLRDLFGIRVESSFMYKLGQERKKKRIEIMSDLMVREVELDDGRTSPALLIDPRHCPIHIEAFKEGYRRRVLDDGTETDEIPDKHPYTDVADSAGMIAVKAFGQDMKYLDTGRPERRERSRSQQTTWRRSGGGRRRR